MSPSFSVPEPRIRAGVTPDLANSAGSEGRSMTPPAVSVEMPTSGQQRLPNQRPYKYGMLMLCLGALINWLGLAENYIEPVRYIGVACIITGAVLICVAMCCWVNSSDTLQVITLLLRSIYIHSCQYLLPSNVKCQKIHCDIFTHEKLLKPR